MRLSSTVVIVRPLDVLSPYLGGHLGVFSPIWDDEDALLPMASCRLLYGLIGQSRPRLETLDWTDPKSLGFEPTAATSSQRAAPRHASPPRHAAQSGAFVRSEACFGVRKTS